jgi:hypothetical protein
MTLVSGGRARVCRFSRDGECIEAVEGVRAYQPLRGRLSQASRPNHVDLLFWFPRN